MIFSNIDPLANEYAPRNAAIRQAAQWRSQETVQGGFDLDGLRDELIRALTSELAKDRLGRRGSDRRARREAQRRTLGQLDSHRLAASPTIDLGDLWYSEAPKATGEEQDVTPDDADVQLVSDAKLVDAAIARRESPITALRKRVYMEWLADTKPDAWKPGEKLDTDAKRELWELALSAARDRFEEQDVVARRDFDSIARDEDDLAYLDRDNARAPKGYGMTTAEERRKWLMDARNRYANMLAEALRRHRNLDKERVKQFPALKSEAQFARSVLARHSFLDELERHPDLLLDQPGRLSREFVDSMKAKFSGGRQATYAKAHSALVYRRHLAESGKLDRFSHEFAS